MFKPISLYIALRYARSRKDNGFISFINFFSMIGTALGVMALILVISVMNGFEDQLKQRILGVVPHVVISDQQQGLDNWQQVAVQLERVLGIESATPIVESEGLIQSAKSLKGVMVQGVNPQLEQGSVIAESMLGGDLSNLVAGEYGTVISRSLAQQLNLGIGDKARLMVTGAATYTPLGMMPAQRSFMVVGIFELGSEIDDKVALIHLTDAQRLLKLKPQRVSALRLSLADAFDASRIGSLVSEQLPALQVDTWHKTQGKLFGAVKMEKTMMSLMLALIITVAIFNIVSALVMLVNDKKSDVAILQTLGMDARQVAKVFMLNGCYNGFLGAFFGVVLGVIACYTVNDVLNALGLRVIGGVGGGLPVLMHSSQVVLIALGAGVLSFMATLYPSFYVAKMKPADVLKEE